MAPTATPLSPAVVEITTPILPAAVAAVQLAPESVSLEEGETRQLESVVEDGAGNRLAGRSVAWSSSNFAVAQVSGTGQVTGVSAGAASVTASVGGVGAMATIEVGHGPVASVEIALGSGDQLVAILRDAASHRLQDRTVTWSSSDPGVVDVEAQTGRLTVGAVGIGVATVTAAAEGVIATFSVTANPCYGVTMSPKHGENSDVLLLGSVAVAVIWSPRESAIARAMAKLTSPLLSVVTVANPRKYSPSPNPEGSNSEFEQNWIVNVLGLPWTPVTELLTTEVTTWKFCKLMDLRLLQIQL